MYTNKDLGLLNIKFINPLVFKFGQKVLTSKKKMEMASVFAYKILIYSSTKIPGTLSSGGYLIFDTQPQVHCASKNWIFHPLTLQPQNRCHLKLNKMFVSVIAFILS